VADPSSTHQAPPADPLDARVQQSWTLLGVAIAVLAGLVLAWILLPGLPLAAGVVLGLGGVAGSAAYARRSVDRRDAGRREEVENFARILQGFSRAVSPDAIVDAIMDELGPGMGADHLVVVRRRPGAPILDATLIPTRPGAPSANTVLPAVDLDDATPQAVLEVRGMTGAPGSAGAPGMAAPPGTAGGPGSGGAPPGSPIPPPSDAADRAAERIAVRVRRAFGLTNVLAAPLVVHGELLGAIVISRRRDTPWPEPARRLLATAASEASAALARTVTHRAVAVAATTDALTGLPNRRFFEEYVELLGRGRRADDTIGILMVDVDRFKLLNDRHGHAVGDVVLRAVARTIAAAVRDVDLPARYGGEEFIVLLRRPSRQVALEVGERIREAVEKIDLAALGVEKVTVSVGASMGDGGAERVAELVVAADRALYRAKRFGRNRVEPA
jgi:diguanylate cyclase (GGDEF)-like protein